MTLSGGVSSSYVIEGRGLHKAFAKKRSIRELVTRPFSSAERVRALRGVDIGVREGEVFSLLGPNGAGKTTLLKIFSCLVLPDEGNAMVAGVDTIHEGHVKSKIGLVHSDERSFYWRLSARENLRFFARLYDVPSRSIEGRIAELLERVDMGEAADRPFSGYSSGMKQRICIVRAMLHDPPILFMDEPTRSLDPVSSLKLREFVLEKLVKEDGKTVLLATHDLREAEAMSDRLAILVEGGIREVGTVSEVRRWGVHEQRFLLEMEPGSIPLAGPFQVVSDDTANGVRKVAVVLQDTATFNDMLRSLMDVGVDIRACARVEPDLEDAFSRILASERKEAST